MSGLRLLRLVSLLDGGGYGLCVEGGGGVGLTGPVLRDYFPDELGFDGVDYEIARAGYVVSVREDCYAGYA